MFGMRRREFITLLGGVAAAWPLAARAQQRPLPVIGLLSSRSHATDAPLVVIMREGIKETGLVEGQNFTIDYRSAEGRYDRLASLAADLVHRQVALIVTIGGEVVGWQRRQQPRAYQSSSAAAPIRCAAGS